MSSANPKHILTAAAWPYANGPRHIGHVSGFAIPSDMFSRYQRMAGSKVLMVSGTDEHGTPIQVQADREGVSAQELVDRYNGVIGNDLAVHRPDASRPLQRGHLPDLRLPGRPRRPVRQLRQPARPDRPDQPGIEDQRGDPAVRRAGALLPRPARLHRRAQ